MGTTQITKEEALDNLYRTYRDEITETYATSGKIDLPAVAVIEDPAGGANPFVIVPLIDVYTDVDTSGKITVNSEQLRLAHYKAEELNSSVSMFIVALEAKTESNFGLKDALLVSAKKDTGELIVNTWLKDLDGHDGVLTESIGHSTQDWVSNPQVDSLETAIGQKVVDALWTEYILVSKVEPTLNEEEA